MVTQLYFNKIKIVKILSIQFKKREWYHNCHEKKKMSFMDNRVTNNGEWGSSNKDFLTTKKKKKEFISLVFKMSNISLTFILIRHGSNKLLNMLD